MKSNFHASEARGMPSNKTRGIFTLRDPASRPIQVILSSLVYSFIHSRAWKLKTQNPFGDVADALDSRANKQRRPGGATGQQAAGQHSVSICPSTACAG